MLAEDGLLANYLSRNHQIPHYAESDGERLLMQLRQFISIRNSAGPEAVDEFTRDLTSKKNALGPLLQCPETRDYVLALYDFSFHFHSSLCMTGSWMKTNLNDVFGGVSEMIL